MRADLGTPQRPWVKRLRADHNGFACCAVSRKRTGLQPRGPSGMTLSWPGFFAEQLSLLAAGLPSVEAATGVRWFCPHSCLDCTTPFPNRLFSWRAAEPELLTWSTARSAANGDPVAIERYGLECNRPPVLRMPWLPGVGDHGGGPNAEMLGNWALWQTAGGG